jgi:hypothetical protein
VFPFEDALLESLCWVELVELPREIVCREPGLRGVPGSGDVLVTIELAANETGEAERLGAGVGRLGIVRVELSPGNITDSLSVSGELTNMLSFRSSFWHNSTVLITSVGVW